MVLAALSSCTTSRPRPADVPTLSTRATDSLSLDELAQLPAYLVPAPAGSTPAEKRKWARAQRRNLARAGVTPTTVKIKHSTLAAGAGATAVSTAKNSGVAAGAGATAAAVGKSKAPVAAGSLAAAVDQRKAAQKGGALAAGDGAQAAAVTKSGLPWLVIVLAVLATLLCLNKWLRGRWLL